MILTATPYRISLFGGGTDYPAWYREHGGSVVGFAINKYCYLGVKRPPPGQGCRYRISYSKLQDCDRLEEIHHPAVRGVLSHLKYDGPIDVTYFGDLPSGGGMGASSAFVVGLIQAVRTLQGNRCFSKAELALEASYVEREVIGEAVGDQDQLFASYGGFHRFDIARTGGVTPFRLVPSEGEFEDSIKQWAVLVWTGVTRFAHEMADKVIDEIPRRRWELNALMTIADDATTVIRRGGSIRTIAEYLVLAWDLKRRIHPEISSPEIDALYEKGIGLGAVGGKLLGAGGGGFMLFLVPPGLRSDFEAEIGNQCISVAVADSGCRIVVNEP